MKKAESKTVESGELFCGVERTARLVGDTWTLLIVRDLAHGCQRFGQLQKSVTGISPRTLSDRLTMLETNGLITRRAYAEIPPRVEYSLTEKGAGLVPIIDAMRTYGERWLLQIAGNPNTPTQ